MAVYLISDADWKGASLETIQEFAAAARSVILKYGGKFLTVPQTQELLEGDWKPKQVLVVEFPNAEAIREMWESPEYLAAAAIRRQANADFKIIMVEGAPA